MVATLGQLLIEEKGIAKPYPGIYMDITRMTGVSKVEDIQQEDFEKVIELLDKQIKALLAEKAKNELLSYMSAPVYHGCLSAAKKL